MGLSITYTKTETDFLIQQLEKKTASGYKGDLIKTDVAPTSVGFYGLLETGIYTNLGGINAPIGKLNFASFDGTTWSLIAVDMPKGLDDKTIEDWTAKAFPIGSSVYYNGKIFYNATTVAASGDVPGTSAVWVEKLKNLKVVDEIIEFENYVPSGTEFTKLENFDLAKFTTGKFIYYGGIIASSANHAIPNLDKTVLVNLKGGSTYTVNCNWISGNGGHILYKDDLSIFAIYSENISNQQVTNLGNGLGTFQIDLTSESGDFWLRLSFRYDPATNTLTHKSNVSIKNNTFFQTYNEAITLAQSAQDLAIATADVVSGIKQLEGYVEANTEFFNPSIHGDISKFQTAKFIDFYGNVSGYANGAVPNLDKSVLVKLLGGGNYTVFANSLTENTSFLLLGSNLKKIYSRNPALNNVVLDGTRAKFNVDLRGLSGDFYLRLTFSYNGSSLNKLSEISIKNNSLFKINTVSDVKNVEFKNNLKNQLQSFNFGTQTNYGSGNAVYNFQVKEDSRISVKFRLNKNANDVNSKVPFIRFLNGETESATMGVLHALCTPNSQNLSSVGNSPIPHPKFNSGFYIGSTDFVLEESQYNPLVGDKLFSMWYKGSASEDYPTQTDLENRSVALGLIQDLCVVIENDTFSIIRDGIATDGTTFNNGATSTLFTTSLKTNGEWKTLIALYEEIKLNGVLSDFVFSHLNMSANLTAENILQCGKVRLIGKYKQQVKLNTPNTDATFNFYYDAFPFYVFNKIDIKEHVLDLVVNLSNIDAYIDGQKIGSTAKTSNIEFTMLNGDVQFYDLEYYFNSYGDAEVVSSSRIISERTPFVLGLMGHGFIDNYQTNAPIAQSNGRLADVIKELRKKGYKIYKAQDISEWSVGAKELAKRSAFFMFDDWRVNDGYVDNIRVRNAYTQFGVPINFAVILANAISNKAVNTGNFTALRLNGHDIVNHSLYHDVAMPNKNSMMFWAEISEAQRLATEMMIYPGMFVYNWYGGFIPINAMLETRGVLCAVNSSGNSSSNATNRYFLKRMNISDDTAYQTVINGIL